MLNTKKNQHILLTRFLKDLFSIEHQCCIMGISPIIFWENGVFVVGWGWNGKRVGKFD